MTVPTIVRLAMRIASRKGFSDSRNKIPLEGTMTRLGDIRVAIKVEELAATTLRGGGLYPACILRENTKENYGICPKKVRCLNLDDVCNSNIQLGISTHQKVSHIGVKVPPLHYK